MLTRAYQQATKAFQDHRLAHPEDVREYNHIDVWLHQLVYDYLDYLPRLVSTRKLVEDGSRGINN
jgi:hypothetical protein